MNRFRQQTRMNLLCARLRFNSRMYFFKFFPQVFGTHAYGGKHQLRTHPISRRQKSSNQSKTMKVQTQLTTVPLKRVPSSPGKFWKLGIGLLALSLTPLLAVDSTWNNPGGGELTDGLNWDGPVVGPTQDGVFDLDDTYTATITGDSVVRNLGITQGDVTFQHVADSSLTMNSLYVGASLDTGIDGILTLADGTTNFTTSGGQVLIGSGAGNNGTLNIASGVLNLGVDGSPGVRVDFFAGAYGSSATVNQTDGVVNKLSNDGTFHIGNQGTGVYNLSGGEINIQGNGNGGMVLGRSSASNAGNGTLNVSSGTITFTGGTDMSLGGAQVSEPETGSGTVNQTGGLVSFRDNGNLVLGQRGAGTYNLNGGVLEIGGAGSIYKGSGAGVATFNLAGGTLRVIESDLTTSMNMNLLDLNPAPAITQTIIDTNGLNATLSGDIVGAGTLVKAGTGTLAVSGNNAITGEVYVVQGGMTQAAGTSTINYLAVGSGSGAVGSYELSGGSIDVTQAMQVGDWGGSGTFNQTAGMITVGEAGPGSMNIGNQGGSGVYNLSGGSVSIKNGFANLGRSTQATAGTGELNISDTGLFEVGVNGDLIIGDRDPAGAEGSGVVNQTGGILRVVDSGELWIGSYGAGTYNLNGGVLEIGGSALKANYGSPAGGSTFNLGGGTIKVIGSNLNSSVNAILSAATVSTVDSNGFDATLSGAITGSGALSKIGTGLLTLGGTNEFGVLDLGEGSADITSSTTLTGPAVTTNPALTVDGGSVLTVTSTGELNVVKGRTLVGVGSTGTLTVNGGTTNFGTAAGETGDFARTVIGGTGGTGTLNLQSGKVVVGNAGSDTSYGSMRVGLGAGAVGVFNQTGGVFDASNAGSIAIGQDGGTASYNLSSGTANLGGGRTSFFHVGRGAGTVGNFNISGNSTVTMGSAVVTQGDFYFYAGSLDSTAVGHVNQSDNSILTAERTLFNIGGDSNATGTYTISDSAQLISVSSHSNGGGDRIILGSATGGTGTFTQEGNSLVDLQNGGKVNIAGSTSSYLLNGGTLQVGGANGIYGAGDFVLGGGKLKVTETNLTTSVATELTTATDSTIDTNGLNASLSGILSGAGSLSKTGAGTLILSGNNNYSGGTKITAGIVEAAQNNAVGSGAVTVDGGTFLVDAGVTTSNAVILSGGGYERQFGVGADLTHGVDATSSFVGGANDTTAQILQGNLAAGGPVQTSFAAGSAALNDVIRLSDVYSLQGTDSNIFVLQLSMTGVGVDSYLGWLNGTNQWVNAVEGNTGGTANFIGRAYNSATDFSLGNYGVDTGSGSVWAVLNHNSDYSIVPEPSTLALLGLAGLALLRRRRTRG